MLHVSRKYALNGRNLRCTLLLPAIVLTSLMSGMVIIAGAGAPPHAGEGVCAQLLISTDKDTYLLDPYYWVYEASLYDWGGASPGDLWPPDSYARTVNVTVLLMDRRGYRASPDDVQYEVENATTVIASGDLADRGDGLYTASFEITDSDSGGPNFDGRDLEYFTIRVEANASEGIIDGAKSFKVGRWGCDRCHVGYTGWDGHENPTAKQLYSWSGFPEGGPGGPHNWENILGGNGNDKTTFDISYLTNSELTHTPSDYLNMAPWHEMTKRKQGGNPKCSPCHQGSGRLRYAYSTPGGLHGGGTIPGGDGKYKTPVNISHLTDEMAKQKQGGTYECLPYPQDAGKLRYDYDYSTLEYVWLEHAKAEVVECTFCHGMDGGYNETYWADTGGYAYGEHAKVDSPPGTDQDPYLAHQSCSNASCHGHISDSDAGAIDNAYPNCSSCHPISFGSEIPQWLNVSTGHPRDVGGHPNSDPVVNCSFCHNSFHSLSDERNIISCGDCHPESENYPLHPYKGYQGGATCSNCHCGSDHLNIHDISIPGCKDCHARVFDSIKDGYNNYAMDDDPANLAPGGSNMTHKRDTRVAFMGNDPQGQSGSGNYFYSRHAYPGPSGGWVDATGPARSGDQICLNCHSEIVRHEGARRDENWDMASPCKPCHTLWADDVTPNPNVHRLSSPHCTDCHSTCSVHAGASLQNLPKDYTRVPAISSMLKDSVHKRLVMNITTGNPSNYHGCLICHTDVDFSISYDDLFEIVIADYGGVHKWSSMPSCTKCHSLDDDIISPGPRAYGHERLDIDGGNNTQCLRCHNIYNQTAGRYHGHNATIESCIGCHYNFAAMNDYGTPEMYVYGNESMGDECAGCHDTKHHPPKP